MNQNVKNRKCSAHTQTLHFHHLLGPFGESFAIIIIIMAHSHLFFLKKHQEAIFYLQQILRQHGSIDGGDALALVKVIVLDLTVLWKMLVSES